MTRETAEREMDTLRWRAERMVRLEGIQDDPIETRASLLPGAIDAPGSEDHAIGCIK